MTSASASRPSNHPLLSGPILPTLLRLAAPNVLAMTMAVAVGVAETWYIGLLGTGPLAAMALVFPFNMLTQMLSSGAMGGGVSSAVSRALGAGDDARADINPAPGGPADVDDDGFAFEIALALRERGRDGRKGKHKACGGRAKTRAPDCSGLFRHGPPRGDLSRLYLQDGTIHRKGKSSCMAFKATSGAKAALM